MSDLPRKPPHSGVGIPFRVGTDALNEVTSAPTRIRSISWRRFEIDLRFEARDKSTHRWRVRLGNLEHGAQEQQPFLPWPWQGRGNLKTIRLRQR